MKLHYDKLLSTFAFNFNLRHYNVAAARRSYAEGCALGLRRAAEGERQGLTLADFRLNVSASCGIGRAFGGCVGGVGGCYGVLGKIEGIFCVRNGSG